MANIDKWDDTAAILGMVRDCVCDRYAFELKS